MKMALQQPLVKFSVFTARMILLILVTVSGTIDSRAAAPRVRYRSLLPEQLAMRFRCPNHYEDIEGDVADVRGCALRELLRRKLLRKGASKVDVLFYLGDPYNVDKTLPPYASVDEFMYGSTGGNIVIEFKGNKLYSVKETSDGEPDHARESVLLH